MYEPGSGRWITSHVMNQDFLAWTGQGVIADRGVVAIRRHFLADLDLVATGGDPTGFERSGNPPCSRLMTTF